MVSAIQGLKYVFQSENLNRLIAKASTFADPDQKIHEQIKNIKFKKNLLVFLAPITIGLVIKTAGLILYSDDPQTLRIDLSLPGISIFSTAAVATDLHKKALKLEAMIKERELIGRDE